MSDFVRVSDIRKTVERSMDMQDSYLPTHFLDILDEVPKADAVEVVRCKDCKHREEECCPDGLLWCNYHGTAMLDYQYCDYGERKDLESE